MLNNGSKTLVIMALTKAVIAVMLVGAACYCAVARIEIPDALLTILVAVLGVYFGFSAAVYRKEAVERTGLEKRFSRLNKDRDKRE